MAAAKISDLVNAVKRWTYSGQGPVQDVDLNQVINDSFTLLRHKASGKKLELDLAEPLPTIPARGVELSQVVTNLIDNALDASASHVTVKTTATSHEVLFEVSDDGAGIARRAALPHLGALLHHQSSRRRHRHRASDQSERSLSITAVGSTWSRSQAAQCSSSTSRPSRNSRAQT